MEICYEEKNNVKKYYPMKLSVDSTIYKYKRKTAVRNEAIKERKIK